MAAEGTRFTDFYMASPVCSPSRGAMLTGCYPSRIGFGEFDGRWVLFPGMPIGLNTSETTVAGILKDSGYATKIVGKWHCGDQKEHLPTRHGFDSYYGIPYSNDMGIQKVDDKYPPLPLLRDETVIQAQPDQRGITERYVEESVRFIRESAGSQTPFFLYLAHMHVHLPHYPPERFLRESMNGPYGGAVAAIDWATDVLLHELQALGLDDDTLIVFTSDNGSRMQGQGASNADQGINLGRRNARPDERTMARQDRGGAWLQRVDALTRPLSHVRRYRWRKDAGRPDHRRKRHPTDPLRKRRRVDRTRRVLLL